MTFAEFQQYWGPARNRIFPSKTYQSPNLARLLGLDYPRPRHWVNIPMTDKLRNQLLALAGPHSDTVQKILKIRQGMDDETF